MSILKIARMGHPVLLRVAAPIADPCAPAVRALIDDMIETMLDAGGAGLAGPQVHVSQRIFVYSVPPSRSTGPDDPPIEPSVLINPVLEPDGLDEVMCVEGCLSIPHLRGVVPRFARVRYAGLDGLGHPVRGTATGFLANVLQHENDHLDGVLYPSRMRDLRRLGFQDEIARYGMPTE
ncbi:peptide deformylase [Ameyamaea chiangmaiensis NBRC 103196]|uniref:Peptide deformylase n=1 Tax=Ameyamaea chiangmaiensis TaxID=442969 RepID=A0A850P8C9_9PROT|nr:peptide deformylase [Ameyamaea chiangmaiensis]MBS4074493.1 peptide deformylase [Ameyamaea chiangmaiensis]NVN39243.1 peptide deformylase [Ameyamaea chiangmaiensis]GBQ72239.1 peptide deformylase [Ameyamaea chiangmaiensis NBRC 103196]